MSLNHSLHRSALILGMAFLSLLVSCGGGDDGAVVKEVKIEEERPHNPENFTQGFLFHDGFLYEGTGQRGASRIQKIDPETGKVVKEAKLAQQLFGEGICIFDGSIYQLTWKAEKGIIFDLKTMRRRGQFKYLGEGWGLTTDGTHAIMSNGTSTITFRDPKTFKVVRSITVKDGEKEVPELNELEYIDGVIWANVWQKDRIVCIAPDTGVVKYWIDCKPLRDRLGNRDDADSLNGIAFDAATKSVWVTGKNWDRMFRITTH